MPRPYITKRSNAADYLLLFLIPAVVTVLTTRFLLNLMDYPQIAHGRIHLAHSLLGGLFLSIANILLFTIHGKRMRQFATALAGIGFGTFIDEVGKFMTKDNNYFFQPVPMIIYLSFIILFFVYQYLDKYTPRRPKELFYESLEGFEEIAEDQLHPRTKHKIELALQKVATAPGEPYGNVSSRMIAAIEHAHVIPKKIDNRYMQKIKSSWRWIEDFTTNRKPIFYFLLLIFLFYIANTFLITYSFITSVTSQQLQRFLYPTNSLFEMIMLAGLLSSQFVSALVMTRGFIFLISRKRLRALEYFKNALAINILVTHVFEFYFRQFSISIELIVTIALYAIVHEILEEEKT